MPFVITVFFAYKNFRKFVYMLVIHVTRAYRNTSFHEYKYQSLKVKLKEIFEFELLGTFFLSLRNVFFSIFVQHMKSVFERTSYGI